MIAMHHRSNGSRVLPAPRQHGGYSRRVSSNTAILSRLTVEVLVVVFPRDNAGIMINAPALASLATASACLGGGGETKPNQPRTGEGAFLRATRKLKRVLQLDVTKAH